MNFTGQLTPQGRALLAKVLTGGTVTVTRVLAGTGTTPEDALTLADPRQTAAISGRCTDGPVATLTVTLAASLADGAYSLTELGVYAQDPDAGEILYQVYRLDEPVEMDPASRLVLRTYLRLAVSGGLDLSLSLPPSGLLVEEDLPPLLRNLLEPVTRKRYVSPEGSDDTGDGSQEHPFLTIQKAVDTVGHYAAGTTEIHLADGTYDESVFLYSIAGPGSIKIIGGEQARVKSICIYLCTVRIVLTSLEVYGTVDEDGSSIFAAYCRYGFFQDIVCTGSQPEDAIYGAIAALHDSTLYLSDTVVSGKQIAVDCMGSTVYLTKTVTGEDNEVAIRSGSSWGSFGGLVFKGGASIAGAEHTAYGGQIFE